MKKNVMTAIVSGAMVGCLAIGGTFAYLTANSGTVKNTFSGSAALGVKIMETATDDTTYDVEYKDEKLADGTAKSTDWLASGEDGFDYINVVPGAVIKKNVDVKVDSNATASYLFVKVTGETADYDLNIGNVWKEVDSAKHIYVLTTDGTTWKVIDADDQEKAIDVFDTVTVNKNLTEVKDVNDIVVTGAVVQATGGITEAEATTEAVNLLK